MAKNRNKRKKSSGGTPVKLAPPKYIQTRARKLPFYKCYVNSEWEDGGMALVLVARQQGGEKLVVGIYLLDTWCLGLKDTFYQFRMDNYEFDSDFIPHIYTSRGLEAEEIDAEYAQNLIYGAIEYAEDLGFSPHKDFKLTEYILEPADSIEVIDFEFGKNGQPHYVAGLKDNIPAILNTLSKNVGEGNFNFTVHDMDLGMDDEEYYEDEEYDEEDEDESFVEDIDFEDVK